MTKLRFSIIVAAVLIAVLLTSTGKLHFAGAAKQAGVTQMREPKESTLRAVSAQELQGIDLASTVFPTFLAVNCQGTRLYIGNDGEGDSILGVDAVSGQVVWDYAADSDPQGRPVTPRWVLPALTGTNIFILNWQNPSLVVLNGTDGTLVGSYVFTEEPMMMTHGMVNGQAILMVTTMSMVQYFRENPFVLLSTQNLPGTSPQKIAYDSSSSRLFIPIFADDIVVSHQLAWNGSSLSVTPTQSSTGDMPTAVVPDLAGTNVAVLSSGDGKITLHNKQTLSQVGCYNGLFTVSDAVYKDGKAVVLSFHNPSAGSNYEGTVLCFDFASRISTSNVLQNRYPVTLDATSVPGYFWAVDRGVYAGNGEIGAGALLKINSATSAVVEALPLSGYNIFTAYSQVGQRLYVSDPPTHSIRVFQLP